jgi:hypothetical protein
MRYKCEECESLFIVNRVDPQVQSGDYQMLPGNSCLLCKSDFKKVDSYFNWDDIISFRESSSKLISLFSKDEGKRLFKLILEDEVSWNDLISFQEIKAQLISQFGEG